MQRVFCKDKELPDAVQKIFKLYEKKLCSHNIDLRYGQLLELRESVLKSQEVDIEYKNYMMNRWREFYLLNLRFHININRGSSIILIMCTIIQC